MAARVPAFPEVQVFEFQRGHAFDKEAAREEMREYVEGNFTRLIEFAFYDSESENDFARPSVDLQKELGAGFGKLFPSELIAEVASDMEMNEGPWESAITGTDSTTAGQRRFAQACNTLHLVASLDVINALHALQDEIRITNTSRSQERHDRLLSRLIWSIRADLGIPSPNDWQSLPVKLWTSGIPLDDPAA
ncbi:hypothetical protein C0Z18_25385 [Trinickia dabaoshanensis]|uniref:Uncharacterized protein n=1 Tax=Trinickia dabaoshanensis TaxID=564714 RepID=A0A2N7VFA0_9BURK|nr:hypothetical protein C0Z18_25385 [Trinickia dabaoshanensis]